jgi:phosphoglycolate phosphatase
MLILFDIDMTLVTTHGSGVRCLNDAGKALFGDGFSSTGIEYGGRLDPLIIHDLLVNARVEPSAEHAAALRAGYAQRMQALHESGDAKSDALPGTHDLVDALADIEGITLGLLTGNFEETGTLKVRHAGFAMHPFAVRVWGDCSPHTPPHRSHLPPVGIERFAALHGRAIDPQQVVIIGDTVHDVSCALDNGCRVLAVATGHHPADQLTQAGAHRVVGDLTRTEELVEWLTTPTLNA